MTQGSRKNELHGSYKGLMEDARQRLAGSGTAGSQEARGGPDSGAATAAATGQPVGWSAGLTTAQTAGQAKAQSPGQPLGQTLGQTPARSLGQTSGQTSGQASARAQGRGAEPVQGQVVEKVFQGEFKVSNDPDCIMTTILGSCIAACVFDPVAGVGGMNHYLLPGEEKKGDGNLRYGVNSMELLLNGMIKMGARHENMRAKVFGGAKMYNGGREIGAKNAAFAKWFLENEGIPVEMSCVGGQLGRKVRFWPATGKAQRAFMEDARQLVVPKVAPKPIVKPEDPGDVELF